MLPEARAGLVDRRSTLRAVLAEVTTDQARAIVAAMRHVATVDGARPLTDVERVAVTSAWHYLLRQTGDVSLDALPDVDPSALSDALADDALAHHALQFIAVVALVDGKIDDDELRVVLQYADALGIDADYLRDLAATAKGKLQAALADMTRQNLLSITGREWNLDDATGWLLPYRDAPDPSLHVRYDALRDEAEGTIGRAFWDWYHGHGFALPGEPDALNESFATPHDSTHVLSGYSTTPQGELLVSTFTAGMHPREPMSGHILPVIYSWHLGIEINEVAGSFRGALAPEKFWVAWDRGAQLTADTFDPGWDLFTVASRPLDDLRAEYHVPPLDKRFAASSDGTEGVDYHPIA